MTTKAFLETLDSKLAQRRVVRTAPAPRIEVIPSGLTILDKYLLGCGGWPCGFAVELMGAEGACKTSLALTSIANAQRLGYSTVLIETEFRFVPDRARALGVRLQEPGVDDPLALAFLQAEDIGELEQRVFAVINAAKEQTAAGGKPVLVFWDSLAITPTAKERATVDAKPTFDKEGNKAKVKGGGIADRAREYSRIIRAISGSVSKAQIAFVVINQLRTDINVMFGDNQVSPGGHATKYWAAARLQLRYPKAIKNGEQHIGKAPKCQTIKSLFNAPYRKANLHFHYDAGWSDADDIMLFGEEHELLAESTKKSDAAIKHVLDTMEAANWNPGAVPKTALGWSPPKSTKAAKKKSTKAKPAAKKVAKKASAK